MAERVLGGRYTVQDKIGIGGMATVYRGLDNVLGRTVAIKTMLPQYAADPSFAARFKQEAQAAAALQSPYIVGVYDWGKDGDTYYIVMEYLRGTDLKSGIRKHGALDCRKVAQIGSQICQALSVAHKHDIIHRDIKPQNIMVQPDGNIKVMDFGIARAKNSHLTADNSVLGTAHYVSPEQTQGKELGPTSDLYSLGIVMYEAATGRVPFDGDDAISVALKQVQEQPVPPSQVNPNIDATLEGIILKCMQKNPADRFQTADELRHVLNDYLAGRIVNLGEATSLMAGAATTPLARNGATQAMPGMRAGKPIAATGRISTTGASQQARQMQQQARAAEEERRHRRRVIGTIVGILAVIAIVAGVVFAMTSGTGSQAVPNLSGLTEDQARAQIDKTNGFFQVGTVTQDYSDTVEQGKLISQSPAQGTSANKGTKIDMVFSKGKKPAAKVTVPDLTNKTLDEANAALKAVGLVPVNGAPVESDTIAAPRVASQDTAAGTEVSEGDSVTFHLSSGKGQADAGDYTGESYSSAKSALEAAGFNVKYVSGGYSDDVEKGYVISQDQARAQIDKTNGFFQVGTVTQDYSDTVEQGKLISQSPAQGTSANKGTKIDMVFSKGKKPAAKVTVPDLTNKTLDEANAALKAVGLVPVNGAPVESDTIAAPRVASQDTAAGTEVSEGDSVTFHLSSGKGQADAGDYTGESYSSAKSALEAAGFNVKYVSGGYSDDVEKGYVISQAPTGEQTRGTTITLTVSQGPAPKTTAPATSSKPATTSSAATTSASAAGAEEDKTSNGLDGR